MDDRTIAELAKLLGPLEPQAVLEFGSRNVNGSARALLRTPAVYLGVDLVPGPDVDIVADAESFWPTFVPDCVVCCETLEHARNAEQIVKHMVDVVAPGGIVLISCAGPARAPHDVDGTPRAGGMVLVRYGPEQPEGMPQVGEVYYGGIDHRDLSRWLLEAGVQDLRVTLARVPSGVHDVYVIARRPAETPHAVEPKPERQKVAGVIPATVVETADISFEDLEKRVLTTRADHGAALQAYHDIWYNCGHTWCYTHFLGVSLMKCPNDLWVYQELMTGHRPRVVIETGTYQGGSALWFAFLMEILRIDGRVYTVDFEDWRRCDHPRVTFLAGDSTDPDVVDAILGEAPEGPRLISLDADHSFEHVLRELELYAPICGLGDWLVVEDTNIAWGETVVRDGELSRVIPGDSGARGAVQDYLERHPGEWRQDLLCERYLLTMHPGGWLQRVGPYVP